MTASSLLKIQIILCAIFLVSCNSDNDKATNPSIQNEINLNEALLSNFLLNEIEVSDIKITQPIIENNQETEEGEILLTLPPTTAPLVFSLKSINFDEKKFSISPGIGIQELFSETDFVKYKITSISNPNINITYNVKAIVSPPAIKEPLAITSFELLSNDNSAFTDIDLVKEAKSIQNVDSLLICLFPKKIDFSDLTPAITFKGTSIKYRINNDDFKEYPVETGKKIDFKFPNTVDFKVSNTTTDEMTIYRIIVDSQHPITFKEQEIIIPNLKVEETSNQIAISTWTNEGNYPISTMSPNQYSAIETPATGLENIFTVTLSKNSGGNINPDQQGTVNVIANNAFVSGMYEVTPIFDLKFNENSWEVNNSPSDDFVTDIGYKKASLTLKGNVTD